MGNILFQHGNLGPSHIHRITNWRFVSTAARMDPSNLFTFRDLDKVCYDAETQEYYVLYAIGEGYVPSWKLISAVEAQGEANTLYTIGTGVPLNGPKIGTTLGIRSLVGTANKVDVTQLPDGTVSITIPASFSINYSQVVGAPDPTEPPPLATDTLDGLMSAADFVKLYSIAPNATVNDTDENLRNRLTHTGTQTADTISDLDPTFKAMLAATIIDGANTTVEYNEAFGTLKINVPDFPEIPPAIATFLELTDTPADYVGHAGKNVRVKADETGLEFVPGGGGTGDTDLSLGVITAATVEVVSSTGTAVILPAATVTDAGVMSAADKAVVASIPSDLAEFVRDTVASFCVASTNITIVHDDTGNTLTFSASGGGGGGVTNLAYTPSPTEGTVTSDTGTDAVIPLADATNAGLQSPAHFTKIEDLGTASELDVASTGDAATGEVVKGNDSRLTDARTPTAHTHTVSDITNFTESVQDLTAAFLVAGTNITITYDDVANTLTFAASGGGGAGTTNLSYTASPTNGTVVSDTGTDAVLPLADATNAGLMTPTQFTKLGLLGLTSNQNLSATIYATGTPANVANTGLTLGYSTSTALGVTGGSGNGLLLVFGQYNGSSYPQTVKRIFIDSLYIWQQNSLNSTTWGDWVRMLRNTDMNSNFLLASTTNVVKSGTNGISNPLNLNDISAASGGAIINWNPGGLRDYGFVQGYVEGLTLGVPGATAGVMGAVTTYSTGNSNFMTMEYRAEGKTWRRQATSTIAWTSWSEYSQAGHTHVAADVTDFTTAVDARVVAGITGKQDTLASGTNIKTINGNSILGSGDLVISGGGSSDPLNEAYEYCDFYGAVIGSIWSGAGVASGAIAAATVDQLVGARGVVRLASSATANSGYNINTAASYLAVAGNTTTRLRFQFLDTAGFATTKLRFGFNGNTSSVDGTNEVSFIIDGGAVTGVCRSGGAVTSTTTLGTMTHSLWYGLKISINSDATAVTFSTYNAAGTLIATETITSTIPVGTPVLRHGVIVTNSGTTSYSVCLLDYIDLKHSSLTRSF